MGQTQDATPHGRQHGTRHDAQDTGQDAPPAAHSASGLSPAAVRAGAVLGPALALLMLWLGAPEGLSPAGWRTLALLAWMVVWWLAEPVPIAATSLLPLVWLPLSGAADMDAAAAAYANPIVFLFVGGFMIAMAIERWGLHARIALGMIAAVGTRPVALIGSFALASGLLSMWISNTATTLMLIPTALGVAHAVAQSARESGEPETAPALAAPLALMVAWAASIGGIGTPVGSPTNLIAMGYLRKEGLQLDFAEWMLIAAPLMLLMLVAVWALLAWPLRGQRGGDGAARALAERRRALGAMRAPERRVLAVFALVAVAWMCTPLLKRIDGLQALNDTVIAIAGALLLFALPAGDADAPRARLLDWNTAVRIPWSVALLFGGGLSVAAAMESHGVSEWLGASLSGLRGLSPLLVLLALAALTVLASEFMSNVATLAAFLPVVGAVSVATGMPPLVLAFAASMSASLAFMMPAGTAPNAIAYGTGAIPIRRMIRTGLWLNLVGIAATAAISTWWAPRVLG